MVEATPADTAISPGLARRFLRLEKYAFPLLYALLAWRQGRFLVSVYATYTALVVRQPSATLLQRVVLGQMVKGGLLLALMVFTGTTLLLSRTPSTLPSKLKQILVPLVMSFYFVLYGVVDLLPPALGRNLVPVAWQLPCSLSGVALSVGGYGLSLWAIRHLGRSFALLVAVRKIVFSGPYVYVRHPIYAGYLLDAAGLLLVTGSSAMLVLLGGFVALLICRARLEEEMLVGAEEQYLFYRRRTGFLFPMLRSLAADPKTRASGSGI